MVMTEQQIFDGFAETIAEFIGIPAAEVAGEADLAEDLAIDSLTMIEIVVSTRDKFDVEISDADLAKLKTVQDVVSYVQRVYVQRVRESGVSA
jgi:acyl carrier protein